MIRARGLRGHLLPSQLWMCNASHRRGLSTGTIPATADVVVIGGGSLGGSIAYHAAQEGLSTVLVEKDKLTAGTTWHSAGMLWRLRPSHVDIVLHAYTRELCLKLEKETGVTSWTENGGLFIACNKERLSEYKRLATLGRVFGIESHVIDPSEVHNIHPLVSVSDVYGAMYSPTDGTIDPTGIVTAYAKAAKSRGAHILESTRVVGIETESYTRLTGSVGKRVTGVRLANGHVIKTNNVVNACGVWANKICEMVGTQIPLRAMKHAMVVTGAIEGMHGRLPNVRDHDLSVYLKAQGNALAIGGYESNPEFWTPDDDFAFGLFELDWDTFGQNLNGHIKRCPAVETAGIRSTVCGPESFTPDHKPLIGPMPGITGFHLACGLNSMGMMLGAGLGREVVNGIAKGKFDKDVFAYDVARYHPTSVADRVWVENRSHESYAKTYSIIFQHDEALAGRAADGHTPLPPNSGGPLQRSGGARVSPVYYRLLEAGCVYQQRHGFERPGWFHSQKVECQPYDFYGAYPDGKIPGLDRTSPPAHSSHPYHRIIESDCTFEWPASHRAIANEVATTRTGASLFDQSYFGKFFVSGPRAQELLDVLCTSDMAGARDGQIMYTTWCNEQGGVEADLTVTKLRGNQGFYIAAGGNTMTKDLRWLEGVFERVGAVVGRDVNVDDKSSDMTMLSLQGRASREILRRIVTSNNTLSNEEFPFSTYQTVELAGKPAMLLRLTFVGELGFEVHVANEHAVAVFDAIVAAGKQVSNERGVPFGFSGYRAIDCMSAEKGYRHWHADLTNEQTPFEANIGFVALNKLKNTQTKFVGRSALEQQRDNGVTTKLVCLTVNDIPLHGSEGIIRNGKHVGFIRSTAYGHSIGKTIAYGYVTCPQGSKITNKWLSEGSYLIDDKGVHVPAELHLKAPFDPNNLRIKGIYGSDESVVTD